MKIFILTGSIAMGKTTVANFLKKLKINVFCADETVHLLYKRQHIIDYIKNIFPEVVINNEVNRNILANYILKDEENRKKIENLIYKYLEKEKLNFLEKNNTLKSELVVLDIPLYFERGALNYIEKYEINKVIVVYTSKEQQRFRALQRPNLLIKNFENILNLQMPSEEKIKKADYIINNNGTIEQTYNQIINILKNEGINVRT